MGLGETHLPRHASVLDGGERGGSCATVSSRDLDHVSLGLGNATCDGTDANRRNKLDGNACLLVDSVKVVDELGKILLKEKKLLS